MSLQYFLYSKQKYEIINAHLNEIIQTFEEMIEYIKTNVEEDVTFNKKEEIKICETYKFMYEQQLSENTYHCKILPEVLQSFCNHNYIKDLIDLTPDKSQTIEYCSICLSQKTEK